MLAFIPNIGKITDQTFEVLLHLIKNVHSAMLALTYFVSKSVKKHKTFSQMKK
jgi:hypothetical protein